MSTGAAASGRGHPVGLQLGLRANWRQFTLLVAVNAFVGSMVGLERVVLPLLAERDFGVASKAAILSFIASFGVVKALANLVAGRMSDRWGRKRLLVAGWLAGLVAPLLIVVAPTWEWVVLANVFLGVNQGLCWSMTVVMKIDLAGPARRGLAMGLNEAAGYLALAAAALASGYLATAYALRPAPFLLGAVLAVMGLVLSVCFVEETHGHARHEAELPTSSGSDRREGISFAEIVRRMTWKDRALFAASQAGMVNNLNDSLAWGLLPLYFAAAGLSLAQIGQLAALYPAVWALLQLGTGPLSDRLGRKWPIAVGMWVQACGIFLLLAQSYWSWVGALVLMGLGTALVYPTLLAAIGDVAHPGWRASAVGVYRLWRDTGYVAGAVLAGLLADRAGMRVAIGATGWLTLVSGIAVAVAMYETLPVPQLAAQPVPVPVSPSDE